MGSLGNHFATPLKILKSGFSKILLHTSAQSVEELRLRPEDRRLGVWAFTINLPRGLPMTMLNSLSKVTYILGHTLSRAHPSPRDGNTGIEKKINQIVDRPIGTDQIRKQSTKHMDSSAVTRVVTYYNDQMLRLCI